MPKASATSGYSDGWAETKEWIEIKYARTPAVWGDAMEVPEIVLVVPSFQVDLMFRPGGIR